LTAEQNDLTMRPITGRDELDLFSRLPYLLDRELAGDLDSGRRRPEWMWLALRGDLPVGAELLALMTLVLDGTLDAHSRADLARMSPEDAAAGHHDDELAKYRSPRDWWRIATLPGGEPVGFVIAARNDYNPIIAYLGVLPAHRGNGYLDEILAEGTRILAAQHVPRIRAATDLGNVPMAAAFARAGYVSFEREINMVWS
jgi:RimJ/RimL family protein N-acetyltransferase